MFRVSVTISDPWDFGEAQRWQPLVGDVVQLLANDEGGRALLHLAEPLTYKGITYEHFVVAPRYDGECIEGIRLDRAVSCGLTGISAAQAKSLDALDTSTWRGGLAFIGTVELFAPGTCQV